MSKNDLSGMKFGRLTVIKKADRPPNVKNRNQYYLCICECGNQTVVSGRSLKTGNTKSCGCLFIEAHTKEDLTNVRFGKLLVLKKVPKPDNATKNETYWLCRCDCGNEKILGRTRLITHNVQSCGCLKDELLNKRKNNNTYEFKDEYVIVYDNAGGQFKIDIDDYQKLIDFDRYWFVRKTIVNGRKEPYVVAKYKNKEIKLHNFLMNPKENEVVDHINGDVTDNRKSNLRITNKYRNAQNRKIPSNNTSGVKGVNFNKGMGKWVARIGYFGKRIHLGAFDNFEDAVKARKEAEKKYFGEFNRE